MPPIRYNYQHLLFCFPSTTYQISNLRSLPIQASPGFCWGVMQPMLIDRYTMAQV